jgi:predicted RNase H-like HicB family nuclease
MGNKAERYTYRIEWSQEDGIFVARCVEFPGLGAHGHSQEEALRQIKAAVAEALKWLRDEKRSAPEPLGTKKFRGHLTLRVPPEVHRGGRRESVDQPIDPIENYLTLHGLASVESREGD